MTQAHRLPMPGFALTMRIVRQGSKPAEKDTRYFNTVGDNEAASFVDLLVGRAAHHGHEQAFTFLADGETEETQITFAELDRRARAIAALLQGFVTPGERALLIYPPGVDCITGFFGCLYAGVVAVPAYPPDLLQIDCTPPRLQAILADAEASVVLTTEPILALAEILFTQAPDLGALQWMATDTVANGIEYSWQKPALSRESLAFLQYTSGSTHLPRGMKVTHENLLSNSKLIGQLFELASSDPDCPAWAQ